MESMRLKHEERKRIKFSQETAEEGNKRFGFNRSMSFEIHKT
jgi:hypothetical protein